MERARVLELIGDRLKKNPLRTRIPRGISGTHSYAGETSQDRRRSNERNSIRRFSSLDEAIAGNTSFTSEAVTDGFDVNGKTVLKPITLIDPMIPWLKQKAPIKNTALLLTITKHPITKKTRSL